VNDEDSKKGKPMHVITILIESKDHPNAAPITLISLSRTRTMKRGQRTLKLLQIKKFLLAFDIPHELTAMTPMTSRGDRL